MTEPAPEVVEPLTPQALANYLGSREGTSDLVEMQRLLDIATEQVEDRCGPLDRAARTFTVHQNGCHLVLPATRLSGVITVTTPDGTVLEPKEVNLLSGIITVGAHRRGAWTITLDDSGNTDAVSPSLVEAVYVIAAHVFNAQRGRTGRPQTSGSPEPDQVPRGFAVPARAIELMRPYSQRAYFA